MSIEITAKIEKKILSADIIKQSLCNFFKCKVNMCRIDKNKYKFTCFYQNDDIIMYYCDNFKCHYWDSIILKEEYSYLQNLLFDVSKYSDVNKAFEIVLKFIIEVQKTYNSEIIITSNIHDEICYINGESKITWSDNYGYIKNIIKCNDLIIEKVSDS